MPPRGQPLADPPRVPTDFDRNARRRESLEVTRQRLRRRPNAAFGKTLAVRTEETAVTVAISEIDADRDRSGRRDFCAARQLCDLRQAATCCHGMPPGTLYQMAPRLLIPSSPLERRPRPSEDTRADGRTWHDMRRASQRSLLARSEAAVERAAWWCHAPRPSAGVQAD